jgi:hypothetical protein
MWSKKAAPSAAVHMTETEQCERLELALATKHVLK